MRFDRRLPLRTGSAKDPSSSGDSSALPGLGMTRSNPIPRLGKILLALFLFALAARLAVTAVTGFTTVRFGDARAYLNAAETIVREGRYPARTDVFFFRPPGYPAFLAVATLGRPDSIPRAKVATAAVGALCAPLLAALSARMFRRRGLAIATGMVAALHPAFLVVASDVQSEPLFLALLLGSGILLLIASDRPSTTLALGAGGLLALAALTRSSALVLAPFLLAPMFDSRYPGRGAAWAANGPLRLPLRLLAFYLGHYGQTAARPRYRPHQWQLALHLPPHLRTERFRANLPFVDNSRIPR